MKILYSLPHPTHRLDTPGAGHTVRANALIAALRSSGAEVVIHQAADQNSAASVYQGVVKGLLPRSVALRLRDRGRVAFGRAYGDRLTAAVRQHTPDVILQTHVAFSLSGALAAENTGVPLVLDDLAPSWEEREVYGVGNDALAQETYAQVTEAARLCVAVSRVVREALTADGLPPERIAVVPNGIDAPARYAAADGRPVRARHNLPEGALVAAYVGSFQPFHRVDILLQAFNRLQTGRDTWLLLVGDGREATAARALAVRLGVAGRVVFVGAVPHDAVPGYLAASDIAVAPGVCDYCNPMKLYEYLASGATTVAPSQATVTEIATHERDALLFPPGDADGLAAALDRLIDDEATRTRLGAEAARTVSGHTWAIRAASLLAAIDDAAR